MLSLIKVMTQYHTRGTRHTQCCSLRVWCVSGGRAGVNTEQPSVWRCGCGAAEQHQLIQCLSQSVKSDLPVAGNTAQNPSPPTYSLPPVPSFGRCQSHLLVPGWMEGTFPHHSHCDAACVYLCVQAGCFSVTHAASVIFGSGRSSPCVR